MTDSQLRKLYKKIDPHPPATIEDAEWWNECFAVMRRAISARTLIASVAVLEKDEWSSPLEAAKILRNDTKGKLRCPRCKGTGYIKK